MHTPAQAPEPCSESGLGVDSSAPCCTIVQLPRHCFDLAVVLVSRRLGRAVPFIRSWELCHRGR